LSQIVLLDVALLRLRRPIHNKPSGYLRFAALATKPGEISGLATRIYEFSREGFSSLSDPEQAGGDIQPIVNGLSSRCSRNLSPLQGWLNWDFKYLGLTPQAMNLTPLRGFLPFIRWRGTVVQASRLHILTGSIFLNRKGAKIAKNFI